MRTKPRQRRLVSRKPAPQLTGNRTNARTTKEPADPVQRSIHDLSALSAADIPLLQRCLGNREVGKIMRQRGMVRQPHSAVLQPDFVPPTPAYGGAYSRNKPALGQISARSVQKSTARTSAGSVSTALPAPHDVQRECAACAEEKEEQIRRRSTQGRSTLAPGQRLANEETIALESSHRRQPAGHTIQKQDAEEENHLRSTTLKGNSRLEACRAGDTSAFVRFGSNGDHVARIQQGLVELGFALPVHGVDGKFGNETASAVKSFQNAHKLAADAVVGVLSITALDDRLAAKQSPPKPNKEDPPDPDDNKTCDVPPDLSQIPTLQTKRKERPSVRRKAASANVIQRAHLPIKDAIDKFADKVNSSEASDPTVTARGQFYWSSLIREKIVAVVSKHFTFLDPTRQDFFDLLDALRNQDAAETARLTKKITDRLKGSSATQDVTDLFKPAPTPAPTALGLWTQFNQLGKVPPDIDKFTNLEVFRRLRKEESTACFSVAQIMIDRFHKQGGFGQKKPTPGFDVSLTDNKATRHFAWKNRSTVEGDVVIYRGIGGSVAKMRDFIDKGGVVHARVLSGVNNGLGLNSSIKAAKDKTPPPPDVQVGVAAEHSLVIIGFDGDEFVFWDPDSGASSLGGRQGFGKLFFQSGRLTTAETEADLFVTEDGNHSGGSGSKRYQVLRISSG